MSASGSHPLSAPLATGLAALGLALAPDQQARLLAYLDLIAKWNRVYNLTAVREPYEMLTHHLLDSLAVVQPLHRHTGGAAARVLDVGSGAGLPGVVLAICEPQMQVDCVDTVAKKAAFIQQVAASLGLANLRGLHDRVEHLAGPYDVVCSRAFASLRDFVTWSAGALAEHGAWMALKGKYPEAEIAVLGQEVAVFHVEPLHVPGLEAERCLVWLKKQPAAR
ncbi:16S rRNA (guanine(527)-N(7))-methyltransferase RsmG [Ramlibacter tataouinensis]|uniref:Ribosomal RNA small subunit methyltransferase G n=1 Tax=Ramlibacter tataouinensis (strain ATCC BAA-407 / DSM 14655 / LMG 21543 / TTB310) TaxID=365046 RepID=F5Y2G1_RAMTT|nr:16S rRNA (guanine(527)-N(7))-methyltransferase RsmG [Ramlibacter tataouinensis]AEG91135.1 Candidate glucose inhibited division protein B [Ramlibacter tataouinensis TTB310]